MPKNNSAPPLNVFLNNQPVGQLSRGANLQLRFVYNVGWLQAGTNMPISLSLPLTEDRYDGAEVWAVFTNLLPDDGDVRRRIAREIAADGADTYSLLAKIGRDCVGALQFVPEDEPPPSVHEIRGRPVSDADIENTLRHLGSTPLGISRKNKLRISLAGAQSKTAYLFHQGQWLEPEGPTPTTHIMKPQIGRLSNGLELSKSVENEFYCLKLLQNFGLKVAQAEMKDFGSQRALVVERFDRQWTTEGYCSRILQEDCCQALAVPPEDKYQDDGGPGIVEILNLLAGSVQAEQDRRDFLKANILFWLTTATDGHAKNFSIFLQPQERFQLTPFYDVITIQDSVNSRLVPRNKVLMAMRAGKRRRYHVYHLSGRDYFQTGEKAGVPGGQITELFEEIRETAGSALDRTAEEMPPDFPGEITRSVGGALRDRLKYLTKERSRW